MAAADEAPSGRAPWPGASDGDLRPFRPADAKAARDRRTSGRPSDDAEQTPWLEDLSLDLLEHLSILSELVTTTTDGSRRQVQALTAKVEALQVSIEALRSAGTQALSAEDLDALAQAVADRITGTRPPSPPASRPS